MGSRCLGRRYPRLFVRAMFLRGCRGTKVVVRARRPRLAVGKGSDGEELVRGGDAVSLVQCRNTKCSYLSKWRHAQILFTIIADPTHLFSISLARQNIIISLDSSMFWTTPDARARTVR